MTDEAKFKLGQVVRHRLFDFRGIIFDGVVLLKNSPILEQIFFVWPSVVE